MLGFLIPLSFNQFDKLPDVVLSCVATNFCVSPLAWWFIILRGAYDLTKDKLQNNTDVLPPKSAPRIVPEGWASADRHCVNDFKAKWDSLWRNRYLCV